MRPTNHIEIGLNMFLKNLQIYRLEEIVNAVMAAIARAEGRAA